MRLIIIFLFFLGQLGAQNVICGSSFNDDIVINPATNTLTVHHAFDVTITLDKSVNQVTYYDPVTNVIRFTFSEGEDESQIWVLTIFKSLTDSSWWYEYHDIEAGIVLYKGDKSLWNNYTEPAPPTKAKKIKRI